MRYKKLTHELVCDPLNPRTLVKAKAKATLGACFHNTAHSIPTEKKKKSNVSSQYKITNYMRKKKTTTKRIIQYSKKNMPLFLVK